jgi:hypothetical protein
MCQSNDSEQQWMDVYTGKLNECVLNDLEPGASYLSRVSCSNDSGASEFSDTLLIRMSAAVPQQCTQLQLNGKPKQNMATVRWGMLQYSSYV